MKRLFWLAGLALAAHAGAQELQACGGEKGFPAWVQGGVYSGTIGKLPIYLQLSRQNSDQTAYFYQSKGVNLQLTPFHDGEVLILQESGWNVSEGREVSTGCLSLSASGKNLTGRWTTPDVKGAQPVTLTPLNVAALPLNLPASPHLQKLRQTDPLSFIKLNRPLLKVAGGLKEPYSGIVYPRIAGANAALNAFLQDRQMGYVLEALDCRSQVGQPDEYTYTVEGKVTWQSNKLLSFSDNVGYYCGGAHPDGYTSDQIFDRQTLKEIRPSAIWPKLTPTRLKALYIGASTTPKDVDPTCRDALADMDSGGMGAALTSKGLEIMDSGLPHVAAACGGGVVIPYAALRAEANKKSVYYREIYR